MEESKIDSTKEERVIKTFDKEYNKNINIMFDKEESDVMSEVIKQLTKFFVEDILKMENLNNNG